MGFWGIWAAATMTARCASPQVEALSSPPRLCCLAQIRVELYDRRQTRFISAHNNPLCCLALSLDGKRLASASEKGTLVRVWSTADGQLLQVRQTGMELVVMKKGGLRGRLLSAMLE